MHLRLALFLIFPSLILVLHPTQTISSYVALLKITQSSSIQSNHNSELPLPYTLLTYKPLSQLLTPSLALYLSHTSNRHTNEKKDNITSIETCPSKVTNSKDTHLIRDLLHLLSNIK
jgi:hypothetical protein